MVATKRPGVTRSWALAGVVGLVAWMSVLQRQSAVLDGCYANGDPGAEQLFLPAVIAVGAGLVAGILRARRQKWIAALAAALLTPVALMVLSWCIGNASLALIRPAPCY